MSRTYRRNRSPFRSFTRGNADHFDRYREMIARRDGPADCHEGHAVNADMTGAW